MEPFGVFPLPIITRRSCCGIIRTTTYRPALENQQLKELIQVTSDNSKSILLQSEKDHFTTEESLTPSTMVDDSLYDLEAQKALDCSNIECSVKDEMAPLCACNYNTGNVVTFKNRCDLQKHNCRFDTAFKKILNEICPWEFEFRRQNGTKRFDYSSSKYFN
ncbi:uncharacterized protein LOC131846555 [Achroia grisella]|uniref:uncharacterized protein LOC131846555 n=1 Tax=Achroia grisella TaxID=688607 RepID=UPI0027D318A1|nr:uncharacterized protein LOC131846555 [Achroia grisella]